MKGEDYRNEILKLLDSTENYISDIKPSDWAEENRVMTSDVSSRVGAFSFDYTPYLREVLDTLSPDHPARIIAVKKAAQVGYALCVHTSVITDKGKKKMLDIQIGDKVFSEKGELISVLSVTDPMYNHQCYNVEFVDGTVIKADAEHLWKVYDRRQKKNKVINTKEISKDVKYNKSNRYYIKNTEALDYPDKELLIDPYLLGIWLGDGHSKSNDISGLKEDLEVYKKYLDSVNISCDIRKVPGKNKTYLLHVVKPKEECLRGHKKDNGKCKVCDKDRSDQVIYHSFIKQLKKLDLYENKHIPQDYMIGSYEQRLKLLQGLMDTDGSICNRSKVSFTNVNLNLINQVKELIVSLGYTASKTVSREAKEGIVVNGVKCNAKTLYKLTFTANDDIPPFKLKRKLVKLKRYKDTAKSRRRSICSVTECESVPVKCITVDSPTNLFLVSNSYIPTHNSTGVIENGIGYIMSQAPGNILFLTGHADLAEEAMNGKIDQMIESCGLRDLIKPNVVKKKNQRTGDTSKSKEFPGGSLIAGSAGNHKLLRQRSVRYGYVDDFDAARHKTKDSGSTTEMIEQRFAAYYDKMKLYYISTPEVKQTSNIEPVYLLGDQRKYFVPCPCCGDYIDLRWTFEVDKTKVGITYDLDEKGKLIDGSVGYTCQSCFGFFKDNHKQDMLRNGEWRPTAEPSEEGYYSYHINALYAPIGMYNWEKYVRQYLKANPKDQPVKESEMQTFTNLVLGEPYEKKGKQIKKNVLLRNVREYFVKTIPESLSVKDGNGRIVLLTCACDLNGVVDDGRLDYEVVAWSESGSSYSVDAGSIGTYVPGLSKKARLAEDRERFSYRNGVENSIWDLFTEVIDDIYQTDTGRKMKILITGIDTGFHTVYANAFVDFTPHYVIGLKGKDADKYRKHGIDTPVFKQSRERKNLYLVEVNQIKEEISELSELKWNKKNGDFQPAGFMNFPQPERGKYGFSTYFEHYEAEHRIMDDEGTGFKWVKKKGNAQNHFFDVRIYNITLKKIVTFLLCREARIKDYTWADYVSIVLKDR